MSKSYVTIERHQCPVCCTVFDTGAILMDTCLTDRFDPTTITGHSLCTNCKNKTAEYLALVEIDPSRSAVKDTFGEKTHIQPQDAYRTGNIVHIRRTVAKQLFNIPVPDDLLMVFTDPDVTALLQKMQEQTEE